ncbi:bifunctional polysaccharide deacetylase/glycosyltransferase family 2 protein [Cryptosporangium aurantiacum]|uniref:Glycosyltransferase, catalytic subunit of cellulose synthase and poly-beta-1,6-N-acetylglucosamine synthase n=1 Tax=Cryptosporangium aurantiacum TaxID=134849 RepID=A0A1M7J9J3_9ACTN|nr:bifunctional polysaccharide deacetylase/glycosyltransferase family 2 protein [Cryptosporangium aurantiacum]SHM49676.1 Glycosyltransferase, catalytic subunit of cellulose synthase and poly-beta-1,6-N-acetylglucosamine synthase [Cryptosporangium aurantiacum]
MPRSVRRPQDPAEDAGPDLAEPDGPPEPPPAAGLLRGRRRRSPSPHEQRRGERRARGRVPVVIVLLIFLCAVLFLNAVATASVGASSTVHEAGSTDDVPSEITEGGPVIDTTQHRTTASFGMKDSTIALTFDDGPDPTWTPKILDVLKEHDVDATFFMVGARITEDPSMTRRVHDEGHEIGIHTFTHADMSTISAWERRLQYSATQMAVVGATGDTTSLLRFPYSSTAAAIDDTYWPIIKEAGDLSYVTVVADVDGEDWARPGVNEIVENATPEDGVGAVVLMHDAGGNREQTVEALDVYIPKMKKLGYTFTTLSEGINFGDGSTATVHRSATVSELWRGRAVLYGIWLAHEFVLWCTYLIILVGALTIARLILMLVLTWRHVARQRKQRKKGPPPPVTLPVSVVVPAYNESAGIEAAVRSLVAGDYVGRAPDGRPVPVEVIVVDDGSTDGTANIVEALGLPNVRIIRVANGGKARALNIGAAATDYPLVVMVDGDTLFEPGSISALAQPFSDPAVGAVAGNVKVGNRRSLLGRWQHIEYVTGFAVDRRAYEIMRCMPTVPGAIGAFRREALEQVGGVSDDTLAEDTDLTMALSRAGWLVVYQDQARAWTETPATMGQLATQRYRWTYGTMQAMWKHRGAFADRGPSGRFGRVGLPFLALFGVVLPLLAPLIDVFLIYGLLFYDAALTALGWLGMLVVQLVIAVIAFRLDRERLRPLWAFPLQQIVYRQLMYVVLIQSVATALTGARLRWQKLRRTGDVQTSPR